MKKNIIVCGECRTGVQKNAVAALSKLLLDATVEYPGCILGGNTPVPPDCRPFYIGTRETNPHIRARNLPALTHAEEYRIVVENDTVMIEGSDDAGVLYGCMDFYDKYIVKHRCTDDSGHYFVDLFEAELPDDTLTAYPSVINRGIWTWGHVIYDYQNFLDNMARLKLNTIIIWNDHAPINAKEIVSYAHDCAIKVIWGYSWLWGTDCTAVDIAHADNAIDTIVETYEREYRDTGADGIYFQSFTEVDTEYINGILVAEAVTSFVNRASARLLEKYPTLELQFGLHAESVSKQLPLIQKVDPRVRIVWENCGSFPYSYIPTDVSSFDETMDLTRRIAQLRGTSERFGVVTKGFTKLDWGHFEHLDNAICLGVSSRAMKENRIRRKRSIWRYLQAGWLINAEYALKAVRTLSNAKQRDLYITALVEDGMFEENILYPVALYAELLWNCNCEIKEVMHAVALREDVEFA